MQTHTSTKFQSCLVNHRLLNFSPYNQILASFSGVNCVRTEFLVSYIQARQMSTDLDYGDGADKVDTINTNI